jgi:hypothetical protein
VSDLNNQAYSDRSAQKLLDEQTERERVKKASKDKAESDRSAQKVLERADRARTREEGFGRQGRERPSRADGV